MQNRARPAQAPALGRSRAQRGVAMMAMLVVLVMGAMFFVLRSLNASTLRADRYRVTQEALIQAKEALIARAVADDNRPGSLPCPDTDDDGSAELFSGNACPSYVGRLPWKSLDLPDLRDASGERLWYALSSTFRDHSSAEPINSNTTGTLTISGTQAASNVVAIVFAPGAPQRRSSGASQSRSCTAGVCDSTASNYLDIASGVDNAAAGTTFVSADESNTFNDRLIPIVHDDIMPLVERRVGRELAQNLRSNYDAWNSPPAVADTTFTNFKGFYPWAATFNNPTVAAPGVTNTTTGLLPFDASSVVWTSATSSLGACTGVNTTQIVCNGTVICINFAPFLTIPCLLTVSGRVSNISTAFLDPPNAASVAVAGTGLGTLTKTWTLNRGVVGTQSTQNLDFSLDSTSFLPGVGLFLALNMTVTVNAPAASAWASSLWLANNKWYQVSYYALTQGYALPSATIGCAAGSTCLTVGNTASPNNDKQAVVVTTGRTLTGQAARPITPPAALTNYLEGGNQVTSDLTFEKNLRTSAFNDQPAVVRP